MKHNDEAPHGQRNALDADQVATMRQSQTPSGAGQGRLREWISGSVGCETRRDQWSV